MSGDNGRPAEAMVKRHDQEHSRDQHLADGCDEPMSPRFLDSRAGAQTALEERLVMTRHVNRDERRRDHKGQEECPSLPVIDCPCGEEEWRQTTRRLRPLSCKWPGDKGSSWCAEKLVSGRATRDAALASGHRRDFWRSRGVRPVDVKERGSRRRILRAKRRRRNRPVTTPPVTCRPAPTQCTRQR